MNDDELRQALATLDAYKGQLNALSGQGELLQISLEESLRARDTLQAMGTANEGDEILIPIGAAVFMPAVVPKKGKAIVGVGTRISVEKSIDDSVEFMKRNIDEITAALRKLDSAMQEVDEAARKLSVVVQQEYERRQQ